MPSTSAGPSDLQNSDLIFQLQIRISRTLEGQSLCELSARLCGLVQDLELWLSKEVVEDGFNLVARAGKLVQEVHVVTKLSSDEMKDAIQRVLLRVV